MTADALKSISENSSVLTKGVEDCAHSIDTAHHRMPVGGRGCHGINVRDHATSALTRKISLAAAQFGNAPLKLCSQNSVPLLVQQRRNAINHNGVAVLCESGHIVVENALIFHPDLHYVHPGQAPVHCGIPTPSCYFTQEVQTATLVPQLSS